MGQRCRFCGAVGVARVVLDRGCVCYPADREQVLCMQHVVGAAPVGGMVLVAVLDDGWRSELEGRLGRAVGGGSEGV